MSASVPDMFTGDLVSTATGDVIREENFDRNERDGRPYVVDPRTGRRVLYTRVSKFADTLDDTYMLDRWKQRMVGIGLVLNPDLFDGLSAVVAEAVEEQWDWAAIKDSVQAVTDQVFADPVARRAAAGLGILDEFAEALDWAADEAGAYDASRKGTLLHALTDIVDRGQRLGDTYSEQEIALVQSWAIETANLTTLGIEVGVVIDEVRTAGTLDRLYAYAPCAKCGCTVYIGDTKTGKTLEYGRQAIAIQLAQYGHGLVYDKHTGSRTTFAEAFGHGDVCLHRAVVMHSPQNGEETVLYWVDIERGWNDALLAAAVRRSRAGWGKTGGRFLPFTAVPVLDALVEQVTSLADARRLHAAHQGDWTDAHTARVTALAEQKRWTS